MFNALKYTQELEKVGFTRNQAETSINLLIDVMNENFATKADLRDAVKDLESKIQTLELKMDSRFNELEYKLTIKLGSMMALAIGVTATLVKLLPSTH